jgi:glycine oxidase
VIGLAIAWRAAQRGLRVTVLERGELGGGTSRVAAGMLAPISEADPSEQALLRLGLAGARAYPEFVEELGDASGQELGHLSCGTLVLARDRDEAEALDRELSFRERLGLRVRRVLASEARALEPALSPSLRLGLEVPDDHAIDPRRLVAGLAAAAAGAGAELRTGTVVSEVLVSGDRVRGVRVGAAERLSADHVVIAAGVWSSAIGGLSDEATIPIHPVKGQILRLRDPAGPGLLSRVLRMRGGYVVPRGDGRYVLGATVEERGYDTTVTAGAVHELLRDAIELLPGLDELVIDELSAGLRPATPDNTPVIGPGALEGLHWAAGHYRNGILLASITAQIVLGAVTGEAPAPAEFAASRFAPVRA